MSSCSATAYSDEQAAELYDVLNGSGDDHDFYLELLMGASAVLDVGCGTGRLLRRAREAGHSGRLCGVDHAGEIDGLLWSSGFEVEARYGGWGREPFEPESPELVSVARRYAGADGEAPAISERATRGGGE